MSAQTAFVIFAIVVVFAILVARTRPPAKSADRAITLAVETALAKDFPFGTIQIDVKTFAGVVILGGFTREFAQAKRAVEIAWATPGVKHVDNRISIRPGD